MKKVFAFLAVLLAVTLFFSFSHLQGGSIRATVIPTDATMRVWAISATDTVRGTTHLGGFEINNVREGVYTVYIRPNAPYKNYTKTGVQVSRGGTTDLGAITLEQ